ncbi:MAG: chromate transporter [Clostridia bacterium]|nr:chromate transporter [Clostridia bacterium]
MKEYFELFSSFARMGAVLFGGGYAMLPMLTREIIEKRGWATEEEILDYFAIAQCTPGVIAVNTATFIGNKRKGVLGAAIATLSLLLVPTILILTIAAILKNFWSSPVVIHAFNGIRVAVSALIVMSVIKLFKSNIKSWQGIVLAAMGFITVAFLKWTPIVATLLAAFCGYLMGRVKAK